MLQRLLYCVSARLPCRIINGEDGAPYLERYYLFSVGEWTFYLHRFVDSDPDRGLHDHPWQSALGWVLAGGYRELRLASDGRVLERRVGPGRFNRVRGDDYHRILLASGRTAWTLFSHGGRAKGWGFLRYRLDAEGRAVECSRQPMTRSSEDHPTDRWWESAPRGEDAGRGPA